MSCLTCLQAKPIPRCITSLVIGTIAINTNVIVKLKTFFGRTEQLTATSNGAGLLTISLADIELSEGIYRISVFATTDLVNELTVTLGASTAECIEVMIQDGEIDTATITEKE